MTSLAVLVVIAWLCFVAAIIIADRAGVTPMPNSTWVSCECYMPLFFGHDECNCTTAR
jgi:hypothetical protein